MTRLARVWHEDIARDGTGRHRDSTEVSEAEESLEKRQRCYIHSITILCGIFRSFSPSRRAVSQQKQQPGEQATACQSDHKQK